MKRRRLGRRLIVIVLGMFFVLSLTVNLALLFAHPTTSAAAGTASLSPGPDGAVKRGDEQLAYLLVKLELQTRREMAGHFTRSQSLVPGVNKLYQRLLVRNLILPAAVADRVFSETVPAATGGRAWVKMVVDEPRNPNNRGDETAVALLAELRQGQRTAERATGDAFYYAEPMRAKGVCLFCHGDPQGGPDPYFPQYRKEGWHEGDIIGAVVARVAPEEPADG